MTQTRRFTLLAAVAASLVSLTLADAAWACSCIRYRQPQQQFDAAELVIRARVVETRTTGPMKAETTFEVVERLKGPAGKQIKIQHGTETGGACGVRFKPGQVVAFTASRTDGGAWSTSSCQALQFDWETLQRVAASRR